ncbi:MAG: hypothetical protein M3Z25_02995 [Actinomycetota bacterium]|nr:hypothetical protein [Actinomycetota bacterium]
MLIRQITGVAAVVAAVAGLVACGSASAPAAGGGVVGYLDAVTAQSPREDGLAAATLPPSMTGAKLLVAIAMGDGPDNPPTQHTVLSDTGNHQWTLRDHHIVFGSIIDVYTAPGTGSEVGSVVSSELTIKRGDEGHQLTVLAYRNGRFDSTTDRNGNLGLPQLSQTVPAGEDVLTMFGDGRHNDPITLVPGFRAVAVFPVDGGPGGDHDLYQVSHLDPPGSLPGGQMLTGNLAPPGSDYWGLVNVNIAPAS